MARAVLDSAMTCFGTARAGRREFFHLGGMSAVVRSCSETANFDFGDFLDC